MSAAKAKSKTAAVKSAAKSAAGSRARWTEEQIRLLNDTVKCSATAKAGFEAVAKQLGKSAGTVQQKYYNLQKQAGGGTKRRGRKPARPAGSANSGATAARQARVAATSGATIPTVAELRAITVDELVGLATRVKAEVDRRRKELEAASKLLAG